MRTFVSIGFLLGGAWAEEPAPAKPPAVFERIAAIRIPNVNLESCTLEEFVDYLRLRLTELDPEKGGGVSILTTGFPPSVIKIENEEGEIAFVHGCQGGKDYHAKNVRVDQLLIEISKVYDVEFHVTDVGMVVTPAGVKPFPNAKAQTGKVFATYGQKSDKAKLEDTPGTGGKGPPKPAVPPPTEGPHK